MSATLTSFCGPGTTQLTLGTSEIGVDYLLINSLNQTLQGPVSGSGSAIVFASLSVSGVSEYHVLGTLSGVCASKVAVVTINSYNLPVVGITNSSPIVCIGNTVTLAGSGATSYSWSGGITNNVGFVPSITATYSVTGTDAFGCQSTAVTTVQVVGQPTVTGIASPSNVVCFGTGVMLSASGAVSYFWNNGVSDGVSFVPTISGTYSVLGVASPGCESGATVTITVNALPTVLGLVSSNIICAGTTVTFNGVGANSYFWSNGVVNNSSFTPLSGGSYSLTGTDVNGCTDSDVVALTVNSLPNVGIQVGASTVCLGGQTTLNGTNAHTFTWTGGVMDGVPFVPSATSNYTVSGTDGNGCINSISTTISVLQNPVLSSSISGLAMYGYSYFGLLSTTPGLSYAVTGLLPSGLMVTNSGIGGIPTTCVRTTQTFTIAGGNGSCNTTQAYQIYVQKAPLSIGALDTLIYQFQQVPSFGRVTVSGARFGDLSLATLQANSTANNAVVGSYPYDLIVSGDVLTNYDITTTTGSVLIGALTPITIAGASGVKFYGDPIPTSVSGTAVLVGTTLPGSTFTLSSAVVPSMINATQGVYPGVTTPVFSGNDLYRYSITTLTGSMEVRLRRLTITALDYIRVDGEPLPTDFPTSIIGLVGSDVVTLDFQLDPKPGKFDEFFIIPGATGEILGKYSIVIFAGTLYQRLGLTVLGTSFTKTYGDNNPVLTGTVLGVNSAAPNVLFNYTVPAQNFSPVGMYTVGGFLTGSDAARYTVRTTPGTLEVTPRALTVSATNFTKLQGAPNPVFSHIATGLV